MSHNDNLLKTLEISWKRLVTLGLVLLCLISLAYCLFKVTYNLLSKPIPASKNANWIPKGQNKTYTPHTTLAKSMFYLSATDFLPVNDQENLAEGQVFHIIKTIPENLNSKCLYGIFRLTKKTYNQFHFKVLEHFEGKRIERYALFRTQSIKYHVLTKNQVSENILNCKNWISVNNDYLMRASEVAAPTKVTTIQFSKPKCTHMNSANIVAVQSNTPNILYFELDRIANKLKMCVQKTGQAQTQIMTMNSGKFQNQEFNIRKHK